MSPLDARPFVFVGTLLAACAPASSPPSSSRSGPVEVAPTAVVAPAKPDRSEGLFDATGLVSPITVRVDRTRTAAGGDCATTRLRVHLTDAAGTKKTVEVGTITGMADDPEKPGFMTPTGDAYSDPGAHCAGLREGVTLRLVGDALVRESAWVDSESGEGNESKPAVKFASGAKVRLE
jgi:hypothetical protein